MKHIEIYGQADTPRMLEAESFCLRAGYAHVLRNTRGDDHNFQEFMRRSPRMGSFPQIFIGSEKIGSLRDLQNLESYIVQQKING